MSIESYDAGRSLDLGTIRNQFAPEATDLELEHFALVCRHLQLDPYADQICLIGRNQKVKVRNAQGVEVERWVLIHKPQITVAGRRAIAARTGRLAGMEGPVWCGPRRFDHDGAKLPLEWLEVWDDDEVPPYAARVLVWPVGWSHPANGTVKWSEFAQYYGTGSNRHLSPFWLRAPSHMLGKVAESLALRRGFAEVDSAVAEYEDRPGFEVDDGSILVEAEAESNQSGSDVPPTREVRRSSDPDRVPDWVYDNLPEANR
jgi:hypothetical protein